MYSYTCDFSKVRSFGKTRRFAKLDRADPHLSSMCRSTSSSMETTGREQSVAFIVQASLAVWRCGSEYPRVPGSRVPTIRVMQLDDCMLGHGHERKCHRLPSSQLYHARLQLLLHASCSRAPLDANLPASPCLCRGAAATPYPLCQEYKVCSNPQTPLFFRFSRNILFRITL